MADRVSGSRRKPDMYRWMDQPQAVMRIRVRRVLVSQSPRPVWPADDAFRNLPVVPIDAEALLRSCGYTRDAAPPEPRPSLLSTLRTWLRRLGPRLPAKGRR